MWPAKPNGAELAMRGLARVSQNQAHPACQSLLSRQARRGWPEPAEDAEPK